MAKLSESVKTLIVQRLACFDSPSAVGQVVKQEFGLELPRQQIANFDPTKAAGKNVSKRLRAIFWATRKCVVEEIGATPISHPSYRLRALNRLLVQMEEDGNVAMMARILEMAAKEVGGFFESRLANASSKRRKNWQSR